MSDFDKEAEREKLREKYGDEEEKREATEQMSELLLKGATMTNAHCTDCGDPIFRYDGQEFCPTCQKPVARQEADDGEGATEAADDDHIEVADPSDDATVQFGDREANGDAAADQPAETGAPGGAAAADRTQPDTQPGDAPAVTDTSQRVPSADPDRSPATDTSDDHDAPVQRQPTVDSGTADSGGRSGGDVASDLAAAESLLAETVHRFAQRAAESEDPRTAREHLSAAREAAEALDAVRF